MDLDNLQKLAAKVALPPGTPMASKKGSEGELYLYSEIGPAAFGGLDAATFVKELRSLGSVDTLTVRVNSIGGSVIEALAIYEAIKNHPAKQKVVCVDGIAASAASFIVMAGTRRVMAETAQMMVHRPWIVAGGDSEELRKMADLLDKNEAILTTIYTKRTGISEERIAAMLKEETWLSAKECLDLNFCDEVTGAVEPEATAPVATSIQAVMKKQLTDADLAIARMEVELWKRGMK